MLTALATAGMGAAYVARNNQSDLWRGAAACFGVALLCVLISWFLVKHRELKRRAFKRHPERHRDPDPFPWWQRSWSWDRAGAVSIFVGVILLAIGFDPGLTT